MKYRIYIDEVGNPDLDSSDNPNHRFLSLTGVILELSYVEKVVHPQMEEIKRKYFRSHPDDPIIFHRKELATNKAPFEVLQDPSKREAFDRELLSLLAAWDYIVISVCLDKKVHKETYTTWRYDPYHYCLAVLLERFVFFLKRANVKGDAMAESRGGKEDRRLKDSFERLWVNGTNYFTPEHFRSVLTSRQLKVRAKSMNVAGLQISDLIAHSSRNEILEEQGLFSGSIWPFGKELIRILQSKYDRQGGRIYGKKFL